MMRFGSRPLALLVSTTAIRPSSATFGFVAAHRPSLGGSSKYHHQKQRFMSSSSNVESTNTARVALCQFKVTEDKELNKKTATSYLEKAADAGAKLAVLPEIWNSPYATSAFGDYAEILPNVGDTSTTTKGESSSSAQLLMDLSRQHKMWIIGGSIPEIDNDQIYNTCLVFSPEGKVVAKHRKVHLFDIDVPGGITFRESDTLSPGEGLTAFDGGEAFGMIGVGICYDIRFPEYALLLGEKHKCNILVYPGAFNLTTGPAHWELLQRARAVDNQCYVLTASPARTTQEEADETSSGKYPHYTAWGHSTAITPWGDVLATCDEKESLVVVDLDLGKVQEMRTGIPVMSQKRRDLYSLQDPNTTKE